MTDTMTDKRETFTNPIYEHIVAVCEDNLGGCQVHGIAKVDVNTSYTAAIVVASRANPHMPEGREYSNHRVIFRNFVVEEGCMEHGHYMFNNVADATADAEERIA